MKVILKINTIFNAFLVASLLVAFFYNAYRYPLQINAGSTSPTYSQTPFILKVSKYLIFSLFYFIAIYTKLFTQATFKFGSRSNMAKTLVAFVLSVLPISWGIVYKSIAIIELGFFFFMALIMHLFHDQKINFIYLGKVLKWGVYVAILYNLVQVLLFAFVGRLPALAYKNSISVRFGSFLDDPNGFGILVALFIGFSYYYFDGGKKWIILGALMLCLLLTQSLTAIASVGLSVSLLMFFYVLYKYRISKQLLLIGVSSLGTVLLVFMIFHKEIIAGVTLFFLLKAGSIEGHAESFNVLADSNILNILGAMPMDAFSETGYINLLTNLGIIYTAIYILYGLYALCKYFFLIYEKRDENKIIKSIACGGFLYLLTFYIALLNLPLEQVFPVNVIGAIFLGLVNSNIIKNKVLYEITW